MLLQYNSCEEVFKNRQEKKIFWPCGRIGINYRDKKFKKNRYIYIKKMQNQKYRKYQIPRLTVAIYRSSNVIQFVIRSPLQ